MKSESPLMNRNLQNLENLQKSLKMIIQYRKTVGFLNSDAKKLYGNALFKLETQLRRVQGKIHVKSEDAYLPKRKKTPLFKKLLRRVGGKKPKTFYANSFKKVEKKTPLFKKLLRRVRI
jgi:hypothetical protein